MHVFPNPVTYLVAIMLLYCSCFVVQLIVIGNKLLSIGIIIIHIIIKKELTLYYVNREVKNNVKCIVLLVFLISLHLFKLNFFCSFLDSLLPLRS